MVENVPSHDESYLLDSPEFWVDQADEIIDQLRLENQILKNENIKLKSLADKYQTAFVTLGIELEKVII
jgi:hypothetical protein